MPNEARDTINELLSKLPKQAFSELGRISAAWVYLEIEVDLAIQCLLTHPKCKGIHEDALIIPFKRRLALLRKLGQRVYLAPVFRQFDSVLGKLANAHGKRAPFIHGRLLPYSRLRFVVENHRHTENDGTFRVHQNWTNVSKMSDAVAVILSAAAHFIAFNRKYLPGSPPSWLDIPKPPYGKPAPSHPHARTSSPKRRNPPPQPKS